MKQKSKVGAFMIGAIALSFLPSAATAAPARREMKIAFARVGVNRPGVFVARANGAAIHRVSHGVTPDFEQEGYGPAWSPSLPWIAFSGSKNGTSGIFRVHPDGSGQERLTSAPCYADFTPSWAPGGRRLVYRHDTCEAARLFVMKPNGSDRTQITRRSSFDPVWGPVHRYIAFVTNVRSGGLTQQIAVVEPDGEELRIVTDSLNASNLGASEPAFSPSGRKILFTGRSALGGGGDRREVCRVRVNGANQRCLTDRGINFDGEYSPDGAKIAYVSKRGGDTEIFSMRPDGARKNPLTDNDASDFDPTWSPDGMFIAFLSTRDGGVDLYVMRRDGTHVRRITNSGAREEQPVWKP